MNEYMAVENAHGERLSTYPDVITTLMPSVEPISAGRLKVGMEVLVFNIKKIFTAILFSKRLIGVSGGRKGFGD